jgi:hypothetical protein
LAGSRSTLLSLTSIVPRTTRGPGCDAVNAPPHHPHLVRANTRRGIWAPAQPVSLSRENPLYIDLAWAKDADLTLEHARFKQAPARRFDWLPAMLARAVDARCRGRADRRRCSFASSSCSHPDHPARRSRPRRVVREDSACRHFKDRAGHAHRSRRRDPASDLVAGDVLV